MPVTVILCCIIRPYYLQDCNGKIEYYTKDIKKIHIDELDPDVFVFQQNRDEYKTVGLFDEDGPLSK